MPVMEKLRIFVAQESVVAASCLIAGVDLRIIEVGLKDWNAPGKNIKSLNQLLRNNPDILTVNWRKLPFVAALGLFLPAVVRPILDSLETSEQVPQPALSDVVAGMTSKKQG